MSNVHDLQRYVKRHPDDRSQRWRLAKKLYMAGDFDDALKHLRVLRKHWPTKLNVARYLAATYYRMGNNTEAIRELERSLEAWPDEVPIRQQLAHALEAAGHTAAAARVWKEILSRQPNHPFARDALANISNRPPGAPLQASAPSQTTAPPETGRTCPNCGAENGDEFERCWQCHATLAAEPDYAPPKPSPKAAAPVLIDLQDHIPVTIASVVIALAATITSAYFLGKGWDARTIPPAELAENATVYAVLAGELLFLRISIAIVLAVACPVALYAASFATRTPMPSLGTLAAVGVANASLATAATMLPVSMLMYAPFLLAAAATGLIVWLFSPRYGRGVAIAAVQCAVILGLSAGAAYQTEGEEFLRELPRIIEYGSEHDAQTNPGRHALVEAELPAEYAFQFSSTGSQWLNEHGAFTRVHIGTDQITHPMDVELFEYEQSMEYYWADPVVIPFNAKLGRQYRLTLGGKTIPASAHGNVVSVLPTQILEGGE